MQRHNDPYQEIADRKSGAASRLNPKNWSKKIWAIVVFIVVVILALVITIPIVVVRANRYPDYTKLNYNLKDTYQGQSFFNNFDYGNGTEKTNGFVNYVTKEGAAFSNLTFSSPQTAIVKVDDKTKTGTAGRPSVKIFSKNQYSEGLFLFDVNHTPFGCGTWPAIWLSDEENWPMNGEIDVVEAVNQANKGNQAALHTTSGCNMKVKRKETGQVLSKDCLNSTNFNQGCATRGSVPTFGQEFNTAGGGVYAMEWRTAGIRIWSFPRSSIPADITSNRPDPSVWGTAMADFPNTECNINSHFKNHKIIININLCGDWAGTEGVYTQEYNCPGKCQDLVGNNPEAFSDAFWEFNSIKVFNSA